MCNKCHGVPGIIQSIIFCTLSGGNSDLVSHPVDTPEKTPDRTETLDSDLPESFTASSRFLLFEGKIQRRTQTEPMC